MNAVKDVRKINRIPLKHVDDIAQDMRNEVLTKAHDTFGYVADEFASNGPLAKILATLGIAPLDKGQVEAYIEVNTKSWQTNYAQIWGVTFAVVPVLSWLALVWYGHFCATWFVGDGFMYFPITMGCVIGGVVLNAIYHIGLIEHVTDRKYEKGWTLFSLGRHDKSAYERHLSGVEPYVRYVPVHLLNYAVQISENLPKAEFFIREMHLKVSRVERPLPDPFLYVRLGSELYYIGVWDEREFEAKM